MTTKATYVWMRVGDQDDYSEYGDVTEAADVLRDLLHGNTFQAQRYIGNMLHGVEIPHTGLMQQNAISLFWGNREADFAHEISDIEIQDLNAILAESDVNPTHPPYESDPMA